MNLTEVVKRIEQFPGALVDCSFGQGRDAFLKQLEARTGRNEKYSVDMYIEDCRDTIAELIERVATYEIPDDYISFLELYGGFLLDFDDYHLSTLGIGPMVENWYSSIDSDDALSEINQYGFIHVGGLSFGKYPEEKIQVVTFLQDLAGTIEKHCVIGIGPWRVDTLTPIDISKDIHAYPDYWRKVANSFTEWLVQVAETQGRFGYL